MQFVLRAKTKRQHGSSGAFPVHNNTIHNSEDYNTVKSFRFVASNRQILIRQIILICTLLLCINCQIHLLSFNCRNKTNFSGYSGSYLYVTNYSVTVLTSVGSNLMLFSTMLQKDKRTHLHARTHTQSVPLFIQKVKGGGRPGGGLQGRTSEEPSATDTGSSTSLGHKGASVREERTPVIPD